MLEGLYGKHGARCRAARTVMADEEYIRESILDPTAKIVAGYQPIMPTFQGQVSEEELLQLIAYIKSLRPGATRARVPPPTGRRMQSRSADHEHRHP